MGFPWIEQHVLLLLELCIVLNAFVFVIPLQWYALLLLGFWAFFLCSHRSWQLVLCAAGLVVWAFAPVVGVTLSVLGLVCQIILPIPQICRSTIVPIGRRSVTLTDDGRYETLNKRHRRVNVSLWYPCAAGNYEYHELFDNFDVVGSALVKVLPAIPDRLRFLFGLMLSHINGPSSALKDAPKAKDEAKRPVVILLHGLTGPRWQYVSLAERLAESGYLVFAPEHPYDTACSVVRQKSLCCRRFLFYCFTNRIEQYEDGTTCLFNLGPPPTDDVFAEEWKKWNGFLQDRLKDTHEMLMPHLRAATFDVGAIDWDKGVSLVRDLFSSFCLVTTRNQIGHSFGAAEALMLAEKDPSVYKQIVCHDLWLYPVPLSVRLGQSVPKPSHSLFISSQNWQWSRNLHRIERVSKAWNE
jgi:pimeloyl-ACP methyl ester carboxylesterase